MEWNAVHALLLFCGFDFAVGSNLATLPSGGQLLGKTYTVYDTKQVTVFLGVRYAKPPTGNLRFRKPEPYEGWTGVRPALEKGSYCPQLVVPFLGNEDCLFLDIVVPGDADPAANKAVMVRIHGGSYISGSGSVLTTTGISVPGDVITVSINYRLGALGFLPNGPGTGNYGLWDQKMALQWVHENIAAFGGDPNRVTIFGESAGAGSVSAQILSEKNDPSIFQRAILQSGTVFAPWSWNFSPRKRQETVCRIKSEAKCAYHTDIYDCLRSKTVMEIFLIVYGAGIIDGYFTPHPDADFFPVNISARGYELANRFDIIVGYNSREGRMTLLGISLTVLTTAFENYNDGLSILEAKKVVTYLCRLFYTVIEVEDCTAEIDNIYALTERVQDAQDRANRLVVALGETFFEVETHRLLKSLYKSSTNSVYGYRLDKGVETSRIRQEPMYTRVGADHGHEVFYVLNLNFISTHIEAITKAEFNGFQQLAGQVSDATPDMQALSNTIVTLLTNFAKSGNPNEPKPTGVVTWPEYGASGDLIRLDDEIEVFNVSTTVLRRYKEIERMNWRINNIFLEQSVTIIDGALTCPAGSSMVADNALSITILILSKLFF